MKIVTKIIMILFFTTLLFSQENTNPVALVRKVVKNVKHETIEKVVKNAKPGTPLLDGELVRTGVKSLALVKFLDGSLIRVRENSRLTIHGKKEGKKQVANTIIHSGELNFDVNKQEEDEFKFTTPTGIASIRGTSGSIEVEENETTFLLEKGRIELEATRGEKKTGTLTPGRFAKIGINGKIIFGELTAKQKQKLKNAKLTKVKKLKIETKTGIYEIEFLDKEN